MMDSISKGLAWLSQFTDETLPNLEAKLIIAKAIYKKDNIEYQSISIKLKHCIGNLSSKNFIPSKYGGNVGSIIYTSFAVKVFADEPKSEKYLFWVLSQQNKKGYWIEPITENLPKHKAWYFVPERRYWNTAIVLQNLWYSKKSYGYEYDRGMAYLSNTIEAIAYQTNNQNSIFIMSYLQFLKLDLWTLAQIMRTLCLFKRKYKNEIDYLENVLTTLKNEILISNIDILQSVCSILIDYSYKKNKKYIRLMITHIINSQNFNGGWGYSDKESDLTLTANVIDLLSKYCEVVHANK